MATIKELREQMARIATEARSKFDEITDKTEETRAAEIEREFDAMMTEHDKIGERVERLEKLEKAEARASEGDPRRPLGGEIRHPGVDEGQKPDYRAAFHAYLRNMGNIGLMTAEERAVLSAGYAAVEHRAQTTTAAAGDYTVPTELMNLLVKSMAAWGPMYDDNVATVINTTGGQTINIPTVNDTSVAVVAHTQGTTLTDTGSKDATFGQKSLGAFAFNTEWLRVSKELADDSIFAMEQLLGDLLGERLGRRANTELTTGVGTTAPTGVVTASTLGKTAATNAAITADEIMDLLHSVNPAYRVGPKVAFMFNDATFAAIRKLKDGQNNYLWQMGDVRVGAPGTLLGHRYYINQAMANIGTVAKSMLFGDFGKYFVRKVGSPLIGAIQDKDFWPGYGIAGYIRFDGNLVDTSAVKHLAHPV